MAKEQTLRISGADVAFFMAQRASATTEARKLLAKPIADALNLQQKTIEDAVKLKVVGADGKNAMYRDKADGLGFWGSLVKIGEAAKEKGIPASVVIAAVNEELGNPDAFDNRANTAKAYRLAFPKVMNVYMSNAWQDACKLVGKDADGNWLACDKDGNALPLHRVSYASARKAFTQLNKTGEEREFARQVALLVSELKEASKNRAKNEKEGIVALAAVPLGGEGGLIETVQSLRGLIPERTVVAVTGDNAGTETGSDEMAEAANAAADDAGMVELGGEPQQQVANG